MLESFCVGKKLIGIRSGSDPAIAEQDVKRLIQENRAREVLEGQVCIGRLVQRIGRHGKYLWFEFDEPPHVFVHFRMTGSFVVRGHQDNYVYETLRRRGSEAGVEAAGDAAAWPPKHTRLIFVFSNIFGKAPVETGSGVSALEVALVDPRRFATIHLCDSASPLEDIRNRVPGFDPLYAMPSLKNFKQRLLSFAGARIKTVLLDQSFVAGLGNWMADEILYYARIHPESRVHDLTSHDIASLYNGVESVVQTSCEVNADPTGFPRKWLFHIRWRGCQKRERVQDGTEVALTADGKRAKFTQLGGRTTVFVPTLQKKRSTPSTRRKGGNLRPGTNSLRAKQTLASPRASSLRLSMRESGSGDDPFQKKCTGPRPESRTDC
ncbi:hypothetical protein CCYA_CCYA05G1576 [Cyanidiococcus yangmingshanensis]|nr:hypothetical protein CCYA_CCYA05G1576 [Cyanidiococcus yangmingshanensis]